MYPGVVAVFLIQYLIQLTSESLKALSWQSLILWHQPQKNFLKPSSLLSAPFGRDTPTKIGLNLIISFVIYEKHYHHKITIIIKAKICLLLLHIQTAGPFAVWYEGS